MRYFIIYVSLAMSFHVLANENDSISRTYYPNGSIQSEGILKDGKPIGFWKAYYPNGVLKSEGSWEKGQLNGQWIFYTNYGDTNSLITYNEGKKSGFSFEYFTERDTRDYRNTIKNRFLYVNNVIHGEAIEYNSDGSILETTEYIKGKKDGLGVIYHAGRIVTIKRYRNNDIVERERINRFDDKGQKVGVWKEFNDDLRVLKEMTYKNNLLDGYYKEYNENGVLTLTILYRDGKILSQDTNESNAKPRQEFYETGELKSSGLYNGNLPIGIHQTFSKDGSVTQTKIYTDEGKLASVGIIDREGNREGKWEVYYPNGAIKTIGEYKNGLREGEWKFLFENGKVEQKGSYTKGKKTGLWIFYYSDGNIWKEEKFFNDLNEGTYLEYNMLGDIIVEGEYFDGEREGQWMLTIGDIISRGKYVTGLRDGTWKSFYLDGRIYFEGNYIQGNEDGNHTFYYADGSVKEERYYNGGLRVKHWKKYDESGNLIITITYKNNSEYRINGSKIEFQEESPRILR